MTISFNRDLAHRFLTAMYTGQPGWLQIVDSGRNFFGQAFTTDEAGIASAVDYAVERDATNPQGIYWRATTMTTSTPTQADGRPGRGGADITASVPLLWADLDYGTEGHKRTSVNKATGKEQLPNPATQDDAYGLIEAAGLPEPTVLIHSGGGLYPLWVLAEAPTLDVAALLSEGIQDAILEASADRGWAYGAGVKDLARVLRLPGSINRKNPDNPRPCKAIGGSGKRIALSDLPKATPPAPRKPPVGNTEPRANGGGERQHGVFDALAEHASWADLLEPADWAFVGTDGDNWERWLRPGGADSEYSARCFEHNMVCHSESAGMPAGAGQRLTKGRVFAWLHHDGDMSAAAKDLLKGGPGAQTLPRVVRDAIIRSTDPWTLPGVAGSTPQGGGHPDPSKEVPPAPAPQGPAAASDEDMEAFVATFTSPGVERFRVNREKWLRDALVVNHTTRDVQFRTHAVAALSDAIAGRYSAEAAVQLLTEVHATTNLADIVDLDFTIRACLAVALDTLEGATR